MTKHLVSVADFKQSQIKQLISSAQQIKKSPKKYCKKLDAKTLLTFFEMPSLRTALSFNVGMSQLGGHVIEYHGEHSPWARGKESIEDVARVMSRYVDCIIFLLCIFF